MNIPAGWYPDPSNTTQLRWWDGDQWTHHVSAAEHGLAQQTYDTPLPSVTNESYEDGVETQAGTTSTFTQSTTSDAESLPVHPLTRLFDVLAALFTIATVCVVGFTFGDTQRSITKMTKEIEHFQRETVTYERLEGQLQKIADELGVGQGN